MEKVGRLPVNNLMLLLRAIIGAVTDRKLVNNSKILRIKNLFAFKYEPSEIIIGLS